MKLKEVVELVENGQYITDKEFRQIEKRVEQVKTYLGISTLYFTSEYTSTTIALLGVFTCEYQMNEYISNNEETYISITIE